jgi:Fungal specific transcription factor domain
MHAILGQAASHLTATTEIDYSSLALSHRLKAIKGLNEALSKTPRTGSDGDALLAACYALTFQTANMKDGMSEFLTMIRGCGLVSFQLLCDQVDISFSISSNRHLEYMQARLDNLPAIDADLYQGAVPSINAILPLCGDVECLLLFHGVLKDCFETIGIDARAGWSNLSSLQLL